MLPSDLASGVFASRLNILLPCLFCAPHLPCVGEGWGRVGPDTGAPAHLVLGEPAERQGAL